MMSTKSLCQLGTQLQLPASACSCPRGLAAPAKIATRRSRSWRPRQQLQHFNVAATAAPSAVTLEPHQVVNPDAITVATPTEYVPSFGGSSVGGSGTSAPKQTATVTIRTKRKVEYGQVIKVVGSGPQMGSWRWEKGPAMKWSEGNNWTLHLELPAGQYEFKLAVSQGSGPHGFEWEDGGNRKLQVPTDLGGSDAAFVVVCDWGRPDKTSLKTLPFFPEQAPPPGQGSGQQAWQVRAATSSSPSTGTSSSGYMSTSSYTSNYMGSSGYMGAGASGYGGAGAASSGSSAYLGAMGGAMGSDSGSAARAAADLAVGMDQSDPQSAYNEQLLQKLEAEHNARRAAETERDQMRRAAATSAMEAAELLTTCAQLTVERDGLMEELRKVREELEEAQGERQRLEAAVERSAQQFSALRSNLNILLSTMEEAPAAE